MSDTVIVAVIAAIGSCLAAVISAAALLKTRQTHLLINSRMDQLLALAASLARAEGVAQGEQAQRERDKP